MVRITVRQRFLHCIGTCLLRTHVYHFSNHFMAPNEDQWQKLYSCFIKGHLDKRQEDVMGKRKSEYFLTLSPVQGHLPFLIWWQWSVSPAGQYSLFFSLHSLISDCPDREQKFKKLWGSFTVVLYHRQSALNLSFCVSVCFTEFKSERD